MALATDANISRLQQMFPTVEGDVIAIILNDCGNNVEQCINHLLEMSEEIISHTGPSHHDIVKQDSWPSVSQSSTKKPQHNKRSPRKRSPGPPSRNPGGPGNRPPGGNPSFQEGNGKRVGSPKNEMKERQIMTNPGGGVAKKPLLVNLPPPRGPGVPPVGNIPPRPPHNQTPPNWQYYSGGRPTYPHPQAMFGRVVYGVGADQKHKLQPRIIAPPGGIPRGPRGGAVFRPNGQFGPGGPPRGIIPIGPNGAPLVHGGMVLRTPVMQPRGAIPINMRPGGMALTYNGRPLVPSGTPVPHPTSEPQKTTNVTNKQSQTVTTTPLNLTQTVVNNNGMRTSGSSVSDSHSPEPHGTGWPVEIESETGTEHLSTTQDDVETGGDSTGDSRMLEKAGREWLSWAKNDSPTPAEKRLILLRGLPGSGKSTLAREIAGKNGVICSTDDFFYNDGRYIFDASKLGEYHDLNKEKAREAMLIENSPVVIDNTNTSAWEMKPYVDIASSMGYMVEIVEPTTPWRFNPSELARRNSHGVPRDKIEKMLERYEHGVTVDSILARRKPTRERASHSFSRRRENCGRGGHVTSHVTGHMTPAHPHYARSFRPSQSHKQQETSKPTSSSSHFSPTELTSTSGTKTSQAPPSNVSLSSYSSNGQICSSHSSPNIASPHFPATAGPSHVAPNLGLPRPSLNTAPNIGLSHIVPSHASTHAAPDLGSHSYINVGLSPNTATSGAAPNINSSFSSPKLGPTSISSGTQQTHSTGKSSVPITSSHSLPNLGKTTNSSGASGRNDTAPFLSPPLPPTAQLHMSKHSPANFNSLHDQRAGNKSNAAQSVAISPSGAPGSTGDPLSPSPSNLTKEEEEQRAAKMSKIWGEGRLSDDTEAHLDRETQTVWGEGVWDAGLSRPVPGRKGATSANLSWDRFGSGSGSNGLGWSGSERVGGEAVSDPVEINGLVGHPLPCEFGPIGKQTKRKQDTKTDENGTTKTKTATNGTTLVGNPKENGKVKKNRASGNGSHSHDKTSDTGQGRRPSHSTRHRSSSTELWVSAETETWPYEEPSENVFHEEKREESVEKRSAGSLAPTSPSLPSHTHRNKSHLSDGSKSPNPSPCEQSGSFADDTSFEDPAIINMVRQSPLPLEGGAHLQDPSWGVDLEPENQEPLFAPPSSETSPEQQKTRPLPSSKRLSLLLSPPSRQPAPANPHLITHTTDTRFNGVTAPTDAYFSGGATSLSRREDTAHSSTNTTTVQCSTPTLIPDDEEEEGELVVEGGRDYFPSAFETDRPSLTPGLCLNESGEVPNNAVIITSSFDAGVVPSSLPVNCVSTSPAESGNCVSLWPSGEKSGKEGEGLVPLEGSPHSSVQEASGESVSYCIGSSSGAAEERHAEEFSPSTKEVPNAQSDLAFLKECFPDLSRPFLKKLLQQSDGNVEEAVSTALVSSVVSPTQPPVGAGEMFNWSPLTVDPFYFGGGLNYWGLGSAFNDGSSAASMTSESEMEGGGGGEEVWASDGDDECMDDGEIARLIQEELDLEASSEEPSLETLWKFAAGETERRGTEEEDDENLVLRLSRSLASQLQQMFGSVDKHLPVEGELRDEDLKVLLSERAARQIWQKWIDTLEAKKVEILLNQDSAASRAKSVPATLVASPDSRPPERSSTEPERLTSIMDEQSAQQTSAKQVRRVVMAACSKNMARTMRLRQLYRQFRTLSKDTIEYVLFKNSFNFSSAAAELEREKACEEGVDGNAASQSGLTSFAGTAAKTTTGAVGPSDKPRAALLQLPSRSPNRRRRRPANKTKQPTRNKEVPIQSLGGLKDAPAYDDLRAEAALHAKLRSEAFQKAAQARGLKQGEVALYYAQKGHSHTEKMKEANGRAAALILNLHNDLSSQFLDLHGLYVDEALAALEGRLQSATDQVVLYVITGKGLHSKGEARIKPAVISYLNSKAYRFEELPGKLKVKLA